MIPFGPIEIDPLALGSQGNAVLGIRDSGKTYTATELAEGLFEAGIPFTAFDPIGVWRFLRVPGAGRGYPVVVAGGQDGDLPLTPASAPAIVEAAMVNGVSLVIDLFDINLSKADWKRIVASSLEVMLHRNTAHGLRHVFIEEAAEFAPQRPGPDAGFVYAAVEKLARMGGNSRLGYTLINQRSEEVSKAVLELCDNLFLHRQKGRNSLTALSRWLDVGNVADHKAIVGTLSTLPTGQCWAWMAGTDQPVLVKVPQKKSFSPDRRVMRGDDGAPAIAKPVDVGGFVSVMKAALAAEETDNAAPTAKGGSKGSAAAKALTEQELEVAEEKGFERGLLEGERRGFDRTRADQKVHIEAAIAQLRKSLLDEQGPLEGEPEPKALPPAAPTPPAQSVGRTRKSTPSASTADLAAKPEAAGMAAGPLAILRSLDWWAAMGIHDPLVQQVAYIAGYAKSGTFDRYRSTLSSEGLITYPGGGRIALTKEGAKRAPKSPTPASMAELHKAARAQLAAPVTKILDVLLSAHPNQITVDQLAERAGFTKSGTFDRYRSTLSSLGLLTYPGAGQVRAADWLFPGKR